MSQRYPNYNVRTRVSLRAICDWRDQSGCAIRIFENFDGGGFNYYIIEFKTMECMRAFMDQFEIIGESWVEEGPRD